MSVLRVGWDIDEPIFKWMERQHAHIVRAGLDNGIVPTTWKPYEEYGLTLEQWCAVLDKGTLAGTLTGRGRPVKGARRQLLRVKEAGHLNVAVTARGNFKYGRTIKRQTKEWVKRHRLPFDELHFARDKTSVPLDTMVDDNAGNYLSLFHHGVDVYLLDMPWNADVETTRRIHSIEEYVDIVLAKAATLG